MDRYNNEDNIEVNLPSVYTPTGAGAIISRMQRFRDVENRTTDGAPLYDSESVRKVLAQAADIDAQAKTEVPLTAAQVEALGIELGLSSFAIQRALGELQSGSDKSKKLSALMMFTITMFPGFVYGVLLSIVFYLLIPVSAWSWEARLLLGMVFIVPLSLSFYFGWKYKDRQLGSATGFFLSFFTILATAFSIELLGGEGSTLYEARDFLVCGLLLIVGGLLGGLGGWVWERRERKPMAKLL